MTNNRSSLLYFITGLAIGVLSNLLPTLHEQRQAVRDGDEVAITDHRDTWVLMGLLVTGAIIVWMVEGKK